VRLLVVLRKKSPFAQREKEEDTGQGRLAVRRRWLCAPRESERVNMRILMISVGNQVALLTILLFRSCPFNSLVSLEPY